MKRFIRLAVVAGLAFAFGSVLAQEETAPPKTPVEDCKPSDPCKDIEPGAASMETPQALEDAEEVETSKAHAKWLEEIWTSP